MQIFDVSDPANPDLKGAYARESSPYAGSVSVDGDYAYVLDNNDVLQIVDIQDSENPTLRQKLDLGYFGASQSDVFAAYPYVYIAWADGNYPENNGLWVVDVRDMDNLIVTNVPTSGFARGVAVSGGYVYLADDPKGLHVFTHGDPVPTGVVLGGESLVKANSTHLYTCGVQYTDGLVSNVTALATWSLLGDAHGATLDGNELTVPGVVSDETLTIQAVYGGFTNTFEVGFVLPTNIFISGSSILIEDSTNVYRCTLQYPDGSLTKATDFATWSLIGDAHGVTLSGNEISVGAIASSETVILQGVYGNLTNTFSVLLKVVPPGFTSLGTLFDDPTANVKAVVYSNGYAYVACGLAGVIVFDVSDSENPVRVGGYDTVGNVKAVALQSNHLFVADEKFGLVILDVTSPSAPVLVGQFEKVDLYNDIAVSDGYVYLAAAHKGLHVFDVRTISSPQYVGKCNISSVQSVSVAGNYAYVVGFSGGLRVIDINTPSTPVLVGSYANLYRSYDVAVQGDYAYVADDTHGLQIINISDPTNPTYVGGYTTKYSRGVCVDGSYAYLANREYGVEVVDISNPFAPVSANTFSCSGSAIGVFVAEGKAYVSGGAAGLYILDASVQPNLSELGTYDTHRYSYDVAVNGSYAYLAAYRDGIITVDISDPNAPLIVATNKWTSSPYAYRLDIVDDMLYVAADSKGLVIYDLVNPAAPSFVTEYDFVTSGAIRDVKVSGNYAYCVNNSSSSTNSLGIVDISDPAHPVYVGGYNTGNRAYGVDVKGTTVYLASNFNGIQIFDASNPANPILKGAYARESSPIAGRVSVDGNYAYVLDKNDVLQIVDIQDSENPTLRQVLDLGTITVENSDIVAAYPYVYIAWAESNSPENNGLWVVDVRNMDNLIVTNFPTSGYARGVAVSGGHIYLADESKGLHIFSHAEHRPTGIAVSGASLISANSTNVYTCAVSYSDGSTSNATASASWSLVGDAHGTSLSGNELTVPSVISDEMITIQAVSDGFTNTLEVGFNVPTNLLVSGPSLVSADSVSLYACEIQYADGSVLDGTDVAVWSLLGDAHGTIIDGNELTAPSVVSDETITIQVVCSGLSNTVEVGFSVPTNLVIFGDSVVNANSTNFYTCGAQFDDGSVSTVTVSSIWSLLGDAHGTTLDGNALSVPAVVFDETVCIKAVYGGVSNTFEISFNTPTNLLVSGISVLVGDSTNFYSCTLQYPDGSLTKATDLATWSFVGDAHGAILNESELSVGTIASSATVTVQAVCGSLTNTHSVLLKVIPPGLTPLGTLFDDPMANAMDVVYSNGYAYLACGYAGLIIFDVSDPVNPVRVGGYDTDGDSQGIAIQSDRVFIADGKGGVCVVDVSDPSSPTLAGSWQVAYSGVNAKDIAVSGDYVYLATFKKGLRIFDISTVSAPQLVGAYDTFNVQGVSVAGDYAYVADYSEGLKIIDVSTPSDPVLAGSYENLYRSYDVAVKGSYAYVADDTHGLQILNVSDPANPTHVGGYTTKNSRDVFVDGSYAYLANGGSGVEIVDIRNPAAPIHVGKFDDNSGTAQGVVVAEQVAYVANHVGGLQILDVSVPAAPSLLNSYDTHRYSWGVEVNGSYAYLAAYRDGLISVDISDPANPVAVDTNRWNSSPQAYGLDVSDDYAYVAQGGRGLAIFDLSVPSSPALVTEFDLGNESIKEVKIVGHYAFCANSYYKETKNSTNALCVVDISDPTSPLFVGGYKTGGNAYGVDIQGQYAYLAANKNGLQILDISNPIHPVFVGAYERVPFTEFDSQRPFAKCVAVSGQYAYLADSGATLDVINISDPQNPVRSGFCHLGWAGSVDLVVKYPYVYIAAIPGGFGKIGLWIVDVSDPENPVVAVESIIQPVDTVAEWRSNTDMFIWRMTQKPYIPSHGEQYLLRSKVLQTLWLVLYLGG